MTTEVAGGGGLAVASCPEEWQEIAGSEINKI